MKILSIGEIMLEMSDVGGGLYKKSFAGDTFNMAHYLNVVTRGGLRADYLTAVGTDAESDACLDFMSRHGVSVTRCIRDEARTIGLFILSNDSAGEKQYGYWRGQSAARHLFDQTQDLTGYNLIYLSGITVAITENRPNLRASVKRAKEMGAQIAYDFNHRAKLWSAEEAQHFAATFLPLTDLVKISDEELDFLYGTSDLATLSRQHPQTEWVLTCGGDRGEIWQNGDRLACQEFAPAASVVDSSAAGDSFIAAYIAAKLEQDTLQSRLKRGHRVASQVVCGKGSIIPIDLTKLD